MIPQELLGSAKVPGQTEELQLFRHDRDFMFRVHGTELMTSREHGSEELLAELSLCRIPENDLAHASVLVGGLGMGFTLAKVLELVGADAKVETVELVSEVIDWNRQWLGDLAGHPLRDERVTAKTGDVVKRIRQANSEFDAILLDVDNGPEGLTRDANGRLYDRGGLSSAHSALRQGGVLAIWSSATHPAFADRIRNAGFAVTEERVRSRRTKGARRTIWVAVK